MLLLKVSAAILVIWYLFRSGRLTEGTFTRLFETNNLPFIMIAVFAFIFSQSLAALRIVFLLKSINFSLSFPSGFQLTMIGNFFNVVIPGMIGGDIVKGFYLFKNEETGKGRTSGIIIMDRFLGFFSILFIGGISITHLLLKRNSIVEAYFNELLMILALIGTALVAAIVYFLLGKQKNIRSRVKEVIPALFRNGIFYNIAEGLGALAKRRRLLVDVFLISIMIQLISLGGLFFLGKMVSETMPDFVLLIAVTTIVLVIGSIPVTPGNIGWTELVASLGWAAIGSDKGADIFIYWRVINLLISLAIGLPCYLSDQNLKQFMWKQKDA